ncbi:hypothetical protein F4818DRAFT_453746 [Hypoxylon cercidicola]|nr:hypothetical protein F4818DRAFT_453746 [Hypoxylon cercidicola]
MASVEHPHGSEPYSTLEVRHVESSEPQDLGNSNKEAVLHPESEYPQIVEQQTQPTWDASKLEANSGSGETAVEGNGTDEANRRVCGLSPRIFYIILATVVVLVIGAIAGGVAGGLAGRQTSSAPDAKATLTTTSLVHQAWQLPTGKTHKALLTGASFSKIPTVPSSLDRGPIKPKPGTSLASASSDSPRGPLYEVHLWFLETANGEDTISEVISPNPAGGPYFWNYVSPGIRTWNKTHLAAAWQRCPNDACDGYWTVAYQGPSGFIRVANSNNWTDTTRAPALRTNAAAAGASLALLPTLNGTNVDGLTLAIQRRPTYMGRSTLQANGSWKQDDGRIMDGIDPLRTRQFAATMMNNWNEALFIALFNDGSVDAARWDGQEYTPIREITFAQGQSTSFSAIATTTDAMFYGIADDQIWEYSIDTTDPSTFTLAGKVYP